MARQISETLCTFDELSDAAKEKARNRWRKFALDHGWWDCTYEDAKTAGIRITGFDLGRSQSITGEFTNDACYCADAIISNHGEDCPTYILAEQFKADRDKIVDEAPRDENGEFENEHALDEALDEVESQLLKDVLQAYWIILQTEEDYLLSDEAIDESIICNECEFYESGEQY